RKIASPTFESACVRCGTSYHPRAAGTVHDARRSPFGRHSHVAEGVMLVSPATTGAARLLLIVSRMDLARYTYLKLVLDSPAAENRGDGPTLDRPALPEAVVAHVKVLARERLPDRRIDDDAVGVAPGRDDALLRVEPEDPRRVRGRHLGEALERHPALHHALGEDDPHTRLRAEVAAGHVLELPAAELQLERRRELIGRRRRD